MRYGYRANRKRLGLLIFAVLLITAGSIIAKEYQIGPEDVLDVSFWQDPSLNAQVRVGQDGNITLGVIGQIQAAGKSTTELQDEIVRLMSRLNKNVSQAVVRVSQYNYNYVFVNGQVRSPGKRAFEEIPDIWTIINEAGGITETADLSRVTVIRGGTNAGRVEIINVSRALAEGKIDKLPQLERGDAIDVPSAPGNITGTSIAPEIEQKNQVYVLGAVNRPGPIAYVENTDFTDLLALAGGPTAGADLKHIKILTKDKYYSQSYQFNFESYAKSGRPARYIVRKEDTYVVPERRGGFFGTGLDVGTVAAAVGVVTSVYLLYDRLSRNNQTTVTTLQ
ncbi:hypothetical protein C3F09_12740 [candidate division GN15 bacterium]|uniref:Soluble ligand binding domain-containing protein n=1 Tax=candidate division GN15 bacterium TaxID=2072418 RepID=A0A855X240_9BACT|nr:MAG: hypothetical protein C3F09_12740 [candidate division GN15 bacterium]